MSASPTPSSSSSSLSSLSPAPSTDDEAVAAEAKRSVTGIERYFKPSSASASSQQQQTTTTTKRTPTPPPPERPPSPPHEYVLADNPDITFIVMFRARFSDCFPKSLPHFGPQDIERDVADVTPGEHVERLLCAVIGLVLNRKKEVERGHYQRALEEVIQTHSSQWPRAWQGKNPLHGGRTFTSMSPEERLTLLKSLILWSLSSSDVIQSKIKESYKQSRRDDDINQPLSVQPWGTDARKRRYWLIEGQDDTHFRLYRETYPNSPKRTTWWSVAGTIDELRTVADRLVEDRNLNSRRLSEKIYASIPRFEASEEKRKRRDYRLARKAAFARPEPGFSLYEGRTRGKKMKYTYSDEEDDVVSGVDFGTRRSARNRQSSPVEQGPVYTASGRQVKARQGGMYGEILSSSRGNRGSSVAGAGTGDENGYNNMSNGRVTRSNFEIQVVNGYKSDEWNSDEKNGDVIRSDGGWENGDDADSSSEGNTGGASDQPSDVQDSLIVRLQYRKSRSQNLVNGNGNGTEPEAIDSDIQNPMPSSPPQLNGTSFSIADIPTAIDTAPTSIPLEQPFEGQQPNGVSLPDATNFHAPAPAPVEKTEQSVSPVVDAPVQEKDDCWGTRELDTARYSASHQRQCIVREGGGEREGK